jgi:hypothetical protein
MTQTLYKLSITIQSYRLFTTTNGKWIMKFLIGWILVCGIMSVCGSLFFCFPIHKAWDDSVKGWCVNRAAINYSVAGFNIVNDIALLFIPLTFLLNLQIPQKKRIILISVFACGILYYTIAPSNLKYVNVFIGSQLFL